MASMDEAAAAMPSNEDATAAAPSDELPPELAAWYGEQGLQMARVADLAPRYRYAREGRQRHGRAGKRSTPSPWRGCPASCACRRRGV